MSDLLLNFFLVAWAYGLSATALVWFAERRGWLRDGAIAETLWRAALYSGFVVAIAAGLRAPLAELWPVEVTNAIHSEDAAPRVESGEAMRAPESTQPQPRAAMRGDGAGAGLTSTVTTSETRPIRPLTVALPARIAEIAAGMLGLLLLVAWAAMAAALWRRQRFLRDALAHSQAAPMHWQDHVRDLDSADLDPQIRSVPALASPLCGGGRLILLPTWCDELDADAQRALLAHELAHLRRRDPLWRVLDAVAVALLLGLPPFRHAAGRLAALAELACDAEAARRSGQPQALAECLAQCLEHHHAATPRLAVAMAADHGGLVERVQRLLEERPMFTSQHLTLRRCLIAVGIALALVVPVVAVNVASDDSRSSIHIRSHSSDLFGSSMSATITAPGRKLEIESDGKITFTPNEDDVATLEAGGEFEIRETRDGVKRSLEIDAVDGKLVRDYRVDGQSRPFDAPAKQWLAGVLPDLFRASGFDAEARAKRIYERAGVDGLLAEIALISSDYARATYIGQLFALADPNPSQVERALTLARAIGSDYELRRALNEVLASKALSEVAQEGVLAAAADIESDYERAELLVAAAERIVLDGTRLAAWQQAAQGIGSDYEQRRVLEALLEQRGDHPQRALLAIALAEEIGSDYEKRMLLAAAADAGLTDLKARSEYTRVAATIGSDYERREALLKLLEQGQVDARLALDVLNAAREIGSDYETKEVLTALAKVMPGDAQVLEVYRSVARELSTYERGEAEQALDRFAET
jgi:beta-lactamase regulating signal transducer with metallopeptidase domain